MIGLIDCNNFFVSCERVFNPSIRMKPVIVFSNNDGCAVSISNEAKDLGIKRGDPYFKIRGACKAYGIETFSGNHKLYGDMSSRVMSTLSSMVPDIEIYSIDEAFLHFDDMVSEDLPDFGREIVRKVRRNTGIPTSLGIAPTKTLAKVAARFAKKYPGYRSCCVIDTEEKRRKALELTPIREIWGIGRRLSRRLADYGINNALQFADWTKEEIEKVLNITGEKTWLELNGQPCVDIESDEAPQKNMICTRSFGKPIATFEELASAMAAFANIVGRKLRERSLCAASLSVFIQTDRFRDDIDQYQRSAHRSFDEPTADTLRLTTVATDALRSIYSKTHEYKRAGIIITELTDAAHIQQSLFGNPTQRERRKKLMSVVDSINRCSLGHDKIHTAAYCPIDAFVRREMPSRLFSTRLSDIIRINCTHHG
ncbi:MAG: Y-family DNA polymerase [Muribaculaceae bacterium]|nr:Y-family DNA polymerase [Muribaculaceae bacterium]